MQPVIPPTNPAVVPPQPQQNAKAKAKGKKGLVIAAASAGGVVVLALLFFFLVLPGIVASKVKDAGDKRALVITYGFPSFGFSSIGLSSVVIKPKSTDRASLTAPAVNAEFSFFTPTAVRIPKAKIEIDGPFRALTSALDAVSEADKKIPDAERLPITIADGTLEWKNPLGSGSRVSFPKLTLAADPRAGTTDLLMSNGSVATAALTLSPLDVHFLREKGDILHLTASLDGDAATLDAKRDADGDEVRLAFTKLSPTDYDDSIAGLDLSKAKVDGSALYQRSSEGAVRSKGAISVAHVALPPIRVLKVFSISLGTSLSITWKASPKKGEPGVMKIDEGKLDLLIAGKTREIAIGGEIDVGADGQGPVIGKLTWQTQTVECADVVPKIGGIAIDGTFDAHGTLKFDLADLASAKLGLNVRQSCSVNGGSLPTDLGGVLNLPSVPGLP